MIDPADIGSPIRNGPVVGVLLAAGVSQRYGERNKLLVDVAGEPMVRRAARTLTESNIGTVVAVVGHDADAIRAALSDVDLEIVENPDYKAGQATSLEVGTRAAATAGAAAACYALGDMPWVATATANTLVRAYRADCGDPLAAAYNGERGNPTLFDARHFDALTGVNGDVGGREILLTDDRAALVMTGDPGVRRDVDRPGDLDTERT